MGRFSTIPQDTFEGLQLGAGMILKNFNPTNPSVRDEDIVCATTGGITVSCIPTYSNLGEDVDNVPAATKELMNLDGWDAKMSFTSLSTNRENIRLALGAADINAETGAIQPRKSLKQSDFSGVWWVGDRADGGMVAARLRNALSTGGLSLKTTKNGKGQLSIELTGHMSLADQETMPMEFYSEDPSTALYNVTQDLTNVTSSFGATTITEGEAFRAELTASADHTIDNVSVYMGGVNITSSAYNAETHVITIGSVSGNISITASATETTGA